MCCPSLAVAVVQKAALTNFDLHDFYIDFGQRSSMSTF